MAVALARLEAAAGEPQTLALLDAAYAGARAHVIGVTGPPGVGKSTLLSRMIRAYRAARAHGRRDHRRSVVAQERRRPARRSRPHRESTPEDQGVFVRSMAARGRLGGLAALTPAAVVLMRSVYDQVIVETVGVGQSETAVAAVSDTVVFCVQPGSGDSLQYMKAGIAEIPDIVVVTKADLGTVAQKAQSDVAAALQLAATPDRQAGRCRFSCSARSARTKGSTPCSTRSPITPASSLPRAGSTASAPPRPRAWLRDALREEFGRHGLARARRWLERPDDAAGQSPFRRLRELARKLRSERGADRFAWETDR